MFDELVAEEQTRQLVAAFGTALSAAGRSAHAANAGETTTYGTYGIVTTYGTYSASTYDYGRAAAAQSAANAQSAADFARIEQTGAQNLAALQQQVLKDNTILPGEWIGGQVVLAPPPKGQNQSVDYAVTIPLGGETHEFLIRQSQQN